MDLILYKMFKRMTRRPSTRCAVTGISLKTLRKIGDSLSIDRIDSNRGYVEGNMQIIALSLNIAKKKAGRVPPYAIKRLMRAIERVAVSKLDAAP
jgi:hypothetical protein